MSWKDILTQAVKDVIEINRKVWEEEIKPSLQFQSAMKAMIEQDYVSAFNLHIQVVKNNPIAMYHVGCMLFTGRGVAKDYMLGFETIKAASACIPQALISIAQIYSIGYPGIPPNKKSALKWFTISTVVDQEFSALRRDKIEHELTDDEILDAQKEAKEWIETHPEWNTWIEGKAYEAIMQQQIKQSFAD
ncbi:tetratricopeptide repeat protein [Pseudodesulfovibrio indicus]|uniref:Sel1 repeat-containing protein n=1 Tax=Pseudodesulfovibrio indicus TaxID=1716143 RepID=A0A126QSE4_9BACT|nr:SEL1-like repeat protein [Pseudodesulfovibrio indicus]AMK12802.1 hypothetical protein AWY79_17665 [Pseudodesulfovibrio indicus]TDT86708.1 Sel1 repeat-containing protein [Pseudodesulfovibrio indicus]